MGGERGGGWGGWTILLEDATVVGPQGPHTAFCTCGFGCVSLMPVPLAVAGSVSFGVVFVIFCPCLGFGFATFYVKTGFAN